MAEILEVGSPTDVVSDMDADQGDVASEAGGVGEVCMDDAQRPPNGDDLPAPPPATLVEAARSKKRERDRGARDRIDTKQEEEDEQSPTKRPHERGDGDLPLTGRELRDLFAQHLFSVKQEMQSAWGDVCGRMETIEKHQTSTKESLAVMGGRLTITEKDNVLQQTELAKHKDQIQGLESAVEDLKNQLEEIKVRGDGPGEGMAPRPPLPGPADARHHDPWAQYLHRRQQQQHLPGRHEWANSSDHAKDNQGRRFFMKGGEPNQDGLSDEDKRALIIGGWAQDTKKEIIENEAAELLQMDSIKPLLDVDRVTVFGPRKSFAIIRFKEREGENYYLVKERMWGVIKAVSALKHVWPSTRQGSQKPAWTSFLKSRTARQRSAHVSMLRRVAFDLAGDAKSSEGAPLVPDALVSDNYDVDWSAGTIWRQDWKLGSATHRQPKGDVKIMTGGWVDVGAMASATGSTPTKVISALERELNMIRDENGKDADNGVCEKHIRLKVASWNLGGQPLDKVNKACPEGDFFFVQEIARREPGWKTDDNDKCVWVSFQHREQWRGTAIGVANDLFDCVVDRRTCRRGYAVVVKLKNIGRVILASIHSPTGVTSDVYGTALHEVGKMFDNKWKHLPCIVGIDVNEQVKWIHDSDMAHGTRPALGNTNFQHMADTFAQHGLRAVPPCLQHRDNPTHFPRDVERQGRQIDMIFGRQVDLQPFEIDAERRIAIGSDHALLLGDVHFKTKRNISGMQIRDQDGASCKYVDDGDVRATFRLAKATNNPQDWKAAHKMRRKARLTWCQLRRERVLRGDWLAYRDHKRDKQRKPGWWGKLLEEKSSAEITGDVQRHPEHKLQGPPKDVWDDFINATIADLPDDAGWKPFTWDEVGAALSEMRANTSVGPDGVGVDLLRHIHQHADLGGDLVSLLNSTVKNTWAKDNWDTSLLALLAKVDSPSRAKDLRPIAMSSAVQKCINKLTMGRVFPVVRRPSGASCCGVGRQAADVIGCFTRLRDNTREWKLPIVCAKLDVRGAFDKIHRKAAVHLLLERTRNHALNAEVKWLIRQLGTNVLTGQVPGGDRITVECTQGIKQGAPESAELFGLLMGCQIDAVLESHAWGELSCPWGDVPLTLLFYQDDVFVWDETIGGLEKRINSVARALKLIGLELAEEKTQVIASPFYTGPRSLHIGEQLVLVQPPGTQIRVVGVNFSFHDGTGQQAKDLLAKAKAALAYHLDLLTESGPWGDKARLLQTLVFGTLSWCAGAVHWNAEDLAVANSIQCTALRRAFQLRRRPAESWVTRTCRQVRAWIHGQGLKRWSTIILELQFGLYGHWGRQSEGVDELGEPCPGNPLRMLRWRSQKWWRFQKSLSDKVGARHPGCFYADSTERKFADNIDLNWEKCTKDRVAWRARCQEWVAKLVVKWARGRQTAIRW
ncbi:pol [Symbiodinium sp. CCMP2592]|nr:pol [Symbiodinium sp. CCMP2592]